MTCPDKKCNGTMQPIGRAKDGSTGECVATHVKCDNEDCGREVKLEVG